MLSFQQINKLKERMRLIDPPSDKSILLFERNLPKIVNTVNEKFQIESNYPNWGDILGKIDFLQDAHYHFANMYLGIHQFKLYEHLVEEFQWYASILKSRGISIAYFSEMVTAWIIAIHTNCTPEAANALIRPLDLLKSYGPEIFDTPEAPAPEPGKELMKFLQLLFENRRRDAFKYLVGYQEMGRSMEEILSNIIIPCMHQVGYLWEQNKISVAEEHTATGALRSAFDMFCQSIPSSEKIPYELILCCVPGNEHELIVEILAGYLETKGWKVRFIGHSTPEDELVRAISASTAFALLLSIALIAHLPSAKRLMERIKKEKGDIRILAGGTAALIGESRLLDLADTVTADFEDTHTTLEKMVNKYA
ncbi:MAG: cobalamin B12-binding domain-containing protein [Thermodesulfobacteriota bacterium]|nr:cobalamin B12-binding domain-containing protein [Thermodesulfobacteriota bacterium]